MSKTIDTWAELAKAGFVAIDTAGTPAHFGAIGKFVLAVSNAIDARLNACLQLQINSNEDAVTRIVVGEMRVGDIMTTLKRIAISRKLDGNSLKCMDDLFSEIQILRHVRDVIAHRMCLVNGDKFAFHNAFLAKTDSAIEVDIYTIADLTGFSEYASRLGYRVIRLLEFLVPVPQSPAMQAYLTVASHTVMVTTHVALVNTGKLDGEKGERLKALENDAHKAIRAYTDAARRTESNFLQLQKAAITATGKYIAAIASADAPGAQSLHEIPPLLRKKDRIPRKGISRLRLRQHPSRQ
jgi:hypothetical protein